MSATLEPIRRAIHPGKARRPCFECGGSRDDPAFPSDKLHRLKGLRAGRVVPLCRACKAKPPTRRTDKQWAATLSQKFHGRRLPSLAALGFQDALQGVNPW